MKVRIKKDNERTHNLLNNSLLIKKQLIHNGYIYLFRGDKPGYTDFKSKLYAKGKKIKSVGKSLDELARLHTEEYESPYISTSTSVITAALYSNKNKIYIVKIPAEDIYIYKSLISDLEKEYLVPDLISKDEIVEVFNHDEIYEIYNFLTKKIGLKITPNDIGIPVDNINQFDLIDLYRLEAKFLGEYISEEELKKFITKNNNSKIKNELEKASSNNDRTHNLYNTSMPININLVHDGYIYLFKESTLDDTETFKSIYYKNGKKLTDTGELLDNQIMQHIIFNVSTFVELTSNILHASIDSLGSKIYLIKIPLRDIVTAENEGDITYLVPDYISNSEIVSVFDDIDIKGIYNYLINVIGLSITPKDIGIDSFYIDDLNIDKLKELKEQMNKFEGLFGGIQKKI